MRTITKSAILLALAIFFFHTGNAQLLKKIKNEAKRRVENRAVNKSGDAVDKGMDKAEESVKGGNKEKDGTTVNEKQDTGKGTTSSDEKNNTGAGAETKGQESLSSFKNFDFVSGDKTIFYTDFSGEKDAELPAKLLLLSGNAEVQTYKGDKVLFIEKEANPWINLQMSSQKYLPEQFTLEFDILAQKDYQNNFRILFRNEKDAEQTNNYRLYQIGLNGISSEYPKFNWETKYGYDNWTEFPANAEKAGQWRHISVYVNKAVGKLYVDEKRVKAVNTLKDDPDCITFVIYNTEQPLMLKNFRLASGGDDSYNKIVTSGKLISYGILFDVNKSELKPQSMGALNEIASMMKEHSDLKLEIGGHTDADGNAETNLKLSELRADAVKQQLIAMGIDESRLTTKGYGSTKPIDNNTTPEGKANNRRVEFVKK